MRRVHWIFALLSLGIGTTLFLRHQHESSLADNIPQAVQPEQIVVEGIGYVEPRTEIRRLAFRSGGIIDKCLVEAGTYVARGEVLAELDSQVQKEQLELAQQRLDLCRLEAEEVKSGSNPLEIQYENQVLARLKIQSDHATREFNRQKRLHAISRTTDHELENAETQMKSSLAAINEQQARVDYLKGIVTPENIRVVDQKVKVAENAVSLAKEDLSRKILHAPFDGIVLRWLKKEGEGVSEIMPEPVMLFGAIDRLHVRAEIDERRAVLVKPGFNARIYGTNLHGRIFSGTVKQVEQIMGSKTIFSDSAAERRDLGVIEVVLEMQDKFEAPIGLRVDVQINVREK